jgi:integrase/recombinase XerD
MPDLLRRSPYGELRDLRRGIPAAGARCTHLLRQCREGGAGMAIEPVTELGGGGALRLPRARVVPLSAPPHSYTAAVERYLTGAGIAKSSARIYRISLTTWGWMLAGEPAPTGPARRGAKPPWVRRCLVSDDLVPGDACDLQRPEELRRCDVGNLSGSDPGVAVARCRLS